MLANLKASYPGTHVDTSNTGNSGNAESMDVESGLSDNIKNILTAKSTEYVIFFTFNFPRFFLII